jgi:hypothetical protein
MAGREATQAESLRAIWARRWNPDTTGRYSALATTIALCSAVFEPGWGVRTARRQSGLLVLHVTVGPDSANQGVDAAVGVNIVGGTGVKAGREFRIEDDAVWTRSGW